MWHSFKEKHVTCDICFKEVQSWLSQFHLVDFACWWNCPSHRQFSKHRSALRLSHFCIMCRDRPSNLSLQLIRDSSEPLLLLPPIHFLRVLLTRSREHFREGHRAQSFCRLTSWRMPVKWYHCAHPTRVQIYFIFEKRGLGSTEIE